jgi:rhodanese-related sulfurtransferase
MKRMTILIVSLALVSVFPLSAAALSQFEEGVTLINTAELRAEVDKGTDLVLINTLSGIEHRDKALPGSINIPYEHVKEGKKTLDYPKDKMLVFYCAGMKCTKSPKTARLAVKQGFTNVYLYQEGIQGWGKAGHKLVTEEAIPRMRMDRFSPEKLETMIADKPGMVILDIRDNDVFNSMKFPYENTLHVQMTDLEERLGDIPRDKEIAVICHAGKQSFKAGPYLKGKGFNVLGCLDGGLMAWKKSGRTVN